MIRRALRGLEFAVIVVPFAIATIMSLVTLVQMIVGLF